MNRFPLIHEEVWYPFSESITEWEFNFHDLHFTEPKRWLPPPEFTAVYGLNLVTRYESDCWIQVEET